MNNTLVQRILTGASRATPGDSVSFRKGHRRAFVWLFLVVMSVIILFPFYIIVTTSLKTQAETVQSQADWFPNDVTFEAYARIFTGGFGTWMTNTLLYAGAGTIAVCVGSALVGYFAIKFPSRVGEVLFWLVVASLLIPGVTFVLGLFQVIIDIQRVTGVRLYGTYWGLLFPACISAFGVFLMRQAMHGISDQMLDAARLDGAREMRIFWTMVVPIVRPQLSALGLFTFLGLYGDLFWPLVMASDPGRYTLSVGLANMANDFTPQWGQISAGAVLTIVPLLILYVPLARYIVNDLGISSSDD